MKTKKLFRLTAQGWFKSVLLHKQHKNHIQKDEAASEFEYLTLLNKGLFLSSLCFLALAGIASPSLMSLPYLLLFLLLTTLYSFHMDLEPLAPIYKLRLTISVYTAIHLVLIYIYQLRFKNHTWLSVSQKKFSFVIF